MSQAIESLDYALRKRLKTRGVFPHDELLVKEVYVALQQLAKK
jgi:transposase-like protein